MNGTPQPPVLVYGLGRSGLATARLLARQGHRIEVFDRRDTGPDIDEALALGADRIETVEASAAAVAIAAPGVPWLHPDLVRLRRRGVETIGEVEWVYRTIDADIVGITGTAGKGTVTRWVSDTLQAAGVDAPAGGNLDPALAAVARDGAILIAELSSFQLERCPTLRPRLAVALNLGVDHLDRHGDVATYHAVKRNLIANLTQAELLVVNGDDPRLAGWAETPARLARFSLTGPADAWLDPTGTIRLHGEPLLGVDALNVHGSHQHANALAVALVCAELGLDRDAIRAGLVAFRGLPGRYARVADVAGVRFVDDSIATRSLAVEAALRATPAPIVWIAGGEDKGADLASLAPLVRERVALLLGVGRDGERFCNAFAADTETVRIEATDGDTALAEAVRIGFERLCGRAGGGTVLLAPLAASFDQFPDYRARSEGFRRAVARLEATWIPCC